MTGPQRGTWEGGVIYISVWEGHEEHKTDREEEECYPLRGVEDGLSGSSASHRERRERFISQAVVQAEGKLYIAYV